MHRSLLRISVVAAVISLPATTRGEDKPTPVASIRVWKPEPGRHYDFQWMNFDASGRYLAIRYSLPDNELLDAALEVYEIATGKRIAGTKLLNGGWNTHGRYPLCTISPRGDWVAYLDGNALRYLTIPTHKPPVPQKVRVNTPFASTCDRLWADANAKGVFVQYLAEEEYVLRWWPIPGLNAEGGPNDRELLRARTKGMRVELFALNADAGIFAAALEPEGNATEKKPLLQTWTMGAKPVKAEFTLPHNATALSVGPHGRRVAVGFPNGSVAWYDISSKKNFKHIALPAFFSVASLSIHPGGKYMACGTFDCGIPNVFFLDLASGKTVAELVGDTKGVCSVCFSSSGSRLAVFGASGTVTIWDADKLLKLERN